MWEQESTQNDKPSATRYTANGHLPTPALSPIDEKGSPGIDLVAGLELHHDQGGRPPDVLDEILPLAEDTGANGVVGTREAAVPSTPRLPKGDAVLALKLSPRQLQDLVTEPNSLPIRPATPPIEEIPILEKGLGIAGEAATQHGRDDRHMHRPEGQTLPPLASVSATLGAIGTPRPSRASRSASTPLFHRKQSSAKSNRAKPELPPLRTEDGELSLERSTTKPSPKKHVPMSPHLSILPVPPLSLPTYLQLELSSDRPSELYIHRAPGSDQMYESSKVKFDRLMNFLLLPPSLEQVLWFGAVACLDAWLYSFTILPLRFLKAIAILGQWCAHVMLIEAVSVWSFVYNGIGRVWQRQRHISDAGSRRPSLVMSDDSSGSAVPEASIKLASKLNGRLAVAQHTQKPSKTSAAFRHRSARSAPSALSPEHKADILQGLLIVATCYVLMWFDASRIYHSIRGQSAIKLYVIYNVLEVFDRLFSALGQDILEVLFSKETLERNDRGRSKILRPFWLWVLALVYNVVHTTALFYQVVTLNVAVNSYSNALLTLLMSNQFVEIKSTVFKKIEKENLFQLTCADIVERFQLWLMLLIIAVRNVVEVGGLSISLTSALASSPVGAASANATRLPLTSAMIIPRAFTMLPKWTGEVLGPFLIVLGSEALVDWCKHAYIGKFNNIKPNIYDRFLDVLAKDYYSHAFADQNLTKRLGLPVIPLSCLFIRACMQTYSMFIAAHLPPPRPSMATAVSLETETATTSPATTAALQHIDHVFRRALGRSAFGAGSSAGSSFNWWSIDDLIAFGTMLTVFLAVFLILLALKLLLGMLLLTFARNRCSSMEERERQVTIAVDGKRTGIGALTEVDESKRKWIYQDDAAGLQALREKEERGRKQVREKGDKLEGVDRYMMAAKRIW
ncbi:hypothetical protein LTR53_013555 [Teratosphaeriaceae sp. CCFEE 6253]|nr:hypothetical protein LTR53_013555 [Teratosphaeriaceae sp. CCFEE 6253]